MTKLRRPGTTQYAVHLICQRLGAERAAQLCGAAPRTLYKWSDPDEQSSPPIAQAIMLDRAYAAAGGASLPLFDLYRGAVAVEVAELDACRLALTDDLAETAREFGDVVESTMRAAQPNATPRDVLTAMQETEELRTATDTVLRRLGSIFRRGAGPRPVMGGTQ